jgi:ubiquinone/menaquinone biosynthesis C-methylase UbiE
MEILDFGAGDGLSTKIIEQRFYSHIVCCDMNESALAINTCGDKVLLRNQQKLPFDDNSFDLVMAVFVMHFILPQKILSEIKRCLKRDGLFAFNCYGDSDYYAIHNKHMNATGLKIICRHDVPLQQRHQIEIWRKML